MRAVLIPEAHERIDVEIVVNLATGMTTFIPDPAEAIAQVVYALGVVTETMKWTRPGWIESPTRFALDPKLLAGGGASQRALPATPVLQGEVVDGSLVTPARTISLQVPRPTRRESTVPDLALDDAFRARLIWFAVDSGLPLQEALGRLFDFYLAWKRRKATIETLAAILQLAQQLELDAIDANVLHEYLSAKADLEKYKCSFADVPETLKLLDLLGQLPHNWTWQQARAAMQAVATFIRAGIPVEQAEAFLTHHQRLRDLDFDETAAVAVAEALTEAGATGERREPVLRTLIGTAASQVDRDALEQELERLRAEIAQLGTLYKTLRQRIKWATSRLTNLQAAEQAALNKKARIDAECRTREADLASLQGLRALLLGKYPEIDTFLNDVERLQTLRKQGYVHIAESLTNGIRIKVIEFLQKVATEAQSG